MLPIEFQLLLLCAHRHLTPAQIQTALTLLNNRVDLDVLENLAQTHGMLMLLYRGLLQLRDHAPAALMAKLEAEVIARAVVYEWVNPQQIASVVMSLDQVNIQAIVLKGAVLGQETYQQPTLRPYGDIDILVHAQDIDATEQQIIALGYEPDESIHSRQWYREQHHHLVPYVRPDSLAIEIHQGLFEATPHLAIAIDLEMLWQQARPITLAGASTYTLCPEHQLIHLCIHAVGVHLFEMGLLHLCDVYETLVQYDLDWELVSQHSTQWGCLRQVQLTLHLVAALFEIPVPQLNRATIPDEFITYSLTNMVNTMVQGVPQSAGLAEIWTEATGWRKIMRMVQRLFPPSGEVATRYRLPAASPLRWVYYPRWQLDMLRRHFGTARQLWRGEMQAHHETVRRDLLAWLNQSN